jgi:Luciferase-like monooxygenase
VTRFEEAFTIIRRLLAGERVSFDGRFYCVDDALLLPKPKRRVPLLIGRSGREYSPLRHLTSNGGTVGTRGTATRHRGSLRWALGSRVTSIGVPASSLRLTGGTGERAHEEESPPIALRELQTHLDELADAGADEAILVLDPINERSVAAVAHALALAPRPAQWPGSH